MAVITVPASGATVSNATLNDTLQADPSVNLKSVPIFYELDGTSTLQSLTIGYDIEVDIGGFSASGTLTGSGTITGPTDASVGNLPTLYNSQSGTVDINGAIETGFSNDGTVTVSAGRRLDLGGEVTSLGTFAVAASGELDLSSRTSAFITALTLNGTLKSSAPSARLQAVDSSGTIDITAGTLSITRSLTGGAVVVERGATFDVGSAQTVAGTVTLNAGSTLRLAQTTTFTGTLQNPGAGAAIDLVGQTISSATVTAGQIVLVTGSGTVRINETGLTSGAVLSTASDGSGGTRVVLAAATAASPGAVVYRFFDTLHGTHFFTADAAEAANVRATRSDLTFEGAGLASVSASDANAVPVYRFFDSVFGSHFYTSSATERDTVLSTRSDLKFEGIGFYEHATQQAGDVATYRFFDTKFGTHFYTSSETERASIVANRPDLTPEGVGFYSPAT